MKVSLAFFYFLLSLNIHAEENCKTLKACSDWATFRTAAKYDLGKYDRRSLRVDKDFSLNEGDADFLFNFILQNNDFARIKREDGNYQVVSIKDIKDFQFPIVKAEEIPQSLDFYSTEFSVPNKGRMKNTLTVVRKMLNKHGRVLEVTDSPKLQVIDTGIHLNALKLVVSELNK